MTTRKETLDSIINMADTINGFIGLPGAAPAILIAKAAAKFLDEAKGSFDEDDEQRLIAAREKLAAKVRQHSVETEASLRG